jgi:dihydroorotate dehydrogenase electron transfer subunit
MQAIILENKRIGNSSLLKTQRDKYYKMKLSCDGFSDASPGQFVMIRVNNSYDPFLRRPMSIYKIDKKRGGFEILYQVVGKGTDIMSGLKKGDEIDVLGPLGQGFSIPKKIDSAIIVAGGIGIAPMVALAEEIRKRGQGNKGARGQGSDSFFTRTLEPSNPRILLSVFIGGKTKNDILCKDDFKKLGAKVHIATEDGFFGKKGTCVDLFKKVLIDSHSSLVTRHSSLVFACGPYGMLKAVADIARDKKIPCQVSLDKRMACGTGACLGCVVRISGQSSVVSEQKYKEDETLPLITHHSSLYKCVCKDGPVFDSEEIDWAGK